MFLSGSIKLDNFVYFTETLTYIFSFIRLQYMDARVDENRHCDLWILYFTLLTPDDIREADLDLWTISMQFFRVWKLTWSILCISPIIYESPYIWDILICNNYHVGIFFYLSSILLVNLYLINGRKLSCIYIKEIRN